MFWNFRPAFALMERFISYGRPSFRHTRDRAPFLPAFRGLWQIWLWRTGPAWTSSSAPACWEIWVLPGGGRLVFSHRLLLPVLGTPETHTRPYSWQEVVILKLPVHVTGSKTCSKHNVTGCSLEECVIKKYNGNVISVYPWMLTWKAIEVKPHVSPPGKDGGRRCGLLRGFLWLRPRNKLPLGGEALFLSFS